MHLKILLAKEDLPVHFSMAQILKNSAHISGEDIHCIYAEQNEGKVMLFKYFRNIISLLPYHFFSRRTVSEGPVVQAKAF